MPGPFDHLDTAQLRKTHNALLRAIPGDATFHATVAAVLRDLIAYELRNPDRMKRDEDAREEAEETAAADKDDQP